MTGARLLMADIKRAVAAEFKVTVLDLESARREQPVARARQVAMSLARELTALSLPQIGRQLGGRDHSTIASGVKAIRRCAGDPELAAHIRAIRRALRPVDLAGAPAEDQFAFLDGPLFDRVTEPAL